MQNLAFPALTVLVSSLFVALPAAAEPTPVAAGTSDTSTSVAADERGTETAARLAAKPGAEAVWLPEKNDEVLLAKTGGSGDRFLGGSQEGTGIRRAAPQSSQFLGGGIEGTGIRKAAPPPPRKKPRRKRN